MTTQSNNDPQAVSAYLATLPIAERKALPKLARAMNDAITKTPPVSGATIHLTIRCLHGSWSGS